MEDQFLTPAQAAKRADVDRNTIYRWMSAGRLTKHKTGHGRVFVDVAELDALTKPQAAPVREAS